MKAYNSLLFILALALSACHTSRNTLPPAPVIITNTDSVRTEYIETLRIDTLIITVSVPAESALQTVNDSTSHVETSIAESDAWINPDGSLGHSIKNKPTGLKSEVYVPTTMIENNKETVTNKETPVQVPYPVEIEREFTLMEQIKLAAFWYLVGAVIVSIGFIFRKPLFTALRKIIRL